MFKNKFKIILICFLIINFIAGVNLIRAESGDYEFIEEIEKRELPNGITVLLREDDSFDIVSMTAVSEIGQKHEPQTYRGINYLTQEMHLEGTENRTSSEIAMDIESLGLNIDVLTSYDYSSYTFQSTPATLNEGLEIYFDLWKNSIFPEEELDSLKDKAKEELAARKDDPFNDAFYTFLETFYEEHPYGQPLRGLKENYQNIEVDHIQEWKTHIYDPENLVISVIGNFNTDKIMETLNSKIGDWKPREAEEVELGPVTPEFTPPLEEKTETVERDAETSWLILGYGTPSVLDADSAALRVLNTVLGGGMDSRLFRNIRGEKGLVYSIGSVYQSFYGPSVLMTYSGTHHTQIDTVRSEILSEIETIKQEKIGEQELQNAREYEKGQYLINNETFMNQAMSIGIYEVMGRGYDWLKEYSQIIEDVSAEDVQAVAQKYFEQPFVESSIIGK